MELLFIIALLVIIGTSGVVFKRLKMRQTSSLVRFGLVNNLRLALGLGKNLDEKIKNIEETLLMADAGHEATAFLLKKLLHQKTPVENFNQVLRNELTQLLSPKIEFKLPKKNSAQNPYIIYLVGVNGVGKTTTAGKLSHYFSSLGLSVALVAADTFRAAAHAQLEIWAKKSNVAFFGNSTAKDPSAVILDGLRQAKKFDVVLVDTAGRLHNKDNLMNELQKMTRMCQKEFLNPPDEVWLILDAMTGQNGLTQAQVFLESVLVSGLILTKYDATAKGGILLAIAKEMQIPVRFLGVGEKLDDLKPFDALAFSNQLLEDS